MGLSINFHGSLSRKIVGWDVSDSLEESSTCMALKKYFYKYFPKKGVLIHSDRGVQYTSKEFRKVLKKHNAVQSMSRKGNCWDNISVPDSRSIIL